MISKPPCTNPCKEAVEYVPVFKGRNADISGLLFVANHPDNRVKQKGLFLDDYLSVLLRAKTGQTLTQMLSYVDLDFDDVLLTNIFKCTLPGDREPKKKEYENCLRVLKQEVEGSKLRGIVAMGAPAYMYMFPEEAKKNNHEAVIGEKLEFLGVPTLILSHPAMLGSIKRYERLGQQYKLKGFLKEIKVQ